MCKHAQKRVTTANIFPYRTRMNVIDQIVDTPELHDQFYQWSDREQEEFLDICTGTKGLKVVYDGVFKEIFNPELTPGRLEDFLSLLLKRKVRIKEVLPNEGARLGGETALLYTDILIELEDGTLCDVEIQRIGIQFPGERGACYSSNHLMRQYKNARDQKGKFFTYRDIKKVYTIVFFEKSSKEFKKCPDHYIHWFHQTSDTGVELELLQEYFFICLDIFKKNMENRSITTDMEAWLAFLSYQNAARAVEIVAYDPKFLDMYQDLYGMILNTERVMQVFSKELAILDQNTIHFMMDEMQAEIDQMKEAKEELEIQKEQLKEQLESQKEELEIQKEQLKEQLESQKKQLKEQLEIQKEELESQKEQLATENLQLESENKRLAESLRQLQQELANLRK